MQFKSDGTLKIMQITDMQEIPAISPDTLALLDAAVEAEHPDLVIYTGDQIKGYGVTYKGKTKKELEAAVAKTITALLEPVTRRHIPFAVTFGNHDRQVGISNADQFNDIYKSLPGCIGEQAEGIPGGGTYAVPLTASDGSGRTVMNLYLFDTGTDAKGGGYEAFDPAIIDWYRKTRDALKAETGHYVPSLVFQHIPMPEYYHVLRRVKKSEKGAIQAFRTHKNEFYKLGDTCRPGDMLEEPPSIPDINNGEFDALHEKGDILGVFVGHDALNMIGIESKGYLYTYLISTTVGYGIAFILNRKITFKADVNPTLSMILYAIMVVFTIFANGWIGSAMTTFAQGHNLTGGFWDMVIKLIGMAIPTLWTYPCNRFIIHRKKKPQITATEKEEA